MTDEVPKVDEPPAEQAAGMPEVDLAQIRVESLMLQVASELMSIGAGHLGLIPGMINGGDGVQARLAIGGADALVNAFLSGLPAGTELPPQVQELRRALAEIKLAFVEAVGESLGEHAPVTGDSSSPPPPPPPSPPPPPVDPPRPKIWTPGGDV